jgi:hypothetical protein
MDAGDRHGSPSFSLAYLHMLLSEHLLIESGLILSAEYTLNPRSHIILLNVKRASEREPKPLHGA